MDKLSWGNMSYGEYMERCVHIGASCHEARYHGASCHWGRCRHFSAGLTYQSSSFNSILPAFSNRANAFRILFIFVSFFVSFNCYNTYIYTRTNSCFFKFNKGQITPFWDTKKERRMQGSKSIYIKMAKLLYPRIMCDHWPVEAGYTIFISCFIKNKRFEYHHSYLWPNNIYKYCPDKKALSAVSYQNL